MTMGKRTKKIKRSSAIVLLAVVLLMLIVGFATTSAEPAFALDKEFLKGATEYFFLFYPESILEESTFIAISPDTTDIANYFRLVLKQPYADYTVKYSDGDNWNTLSIAEKGDINGAECFYVKICYNEEYKFVLEKDGQQIEVKKSFDGFDFIKPYVAYKNATGRTVQVSDAHSNKQHISAKSGIKYVKIYTDSYVFFEQDHINALTHVCDFSNTIGTAISGDLKIDIQDNAGNVHTQVLWEQIRDVTHRNYIEILANIDAYIEFADDNGIGLSNFLVEELKEKRLAIVTQYEQNGTLSTVFSQAMQTASTLVTVNEENQIVPVKSIDEMISFDVADGIILPTSSALYYYKDTKYGDNVVFKIEKGTPSKSDRKNSDTSLSYVVSLTVNDTAQPLSNGVAIYDEFDSQYTLNAVLKEDDSIDFEQSTNNWIRFTITATTTYILHYTTNSGLPWWAWTLIGVGIAAVVATLITVTTVIIKKKKST